MDIRDSVVVQDPRSTIRYCRGAEGYVYRSAFCAPDGHLLVNLGESLVVDAYRPEMALGL